MRFPSLRQFGGILVRAFRGLKRNDPLRMAAATAFFATFALAPIIIILTQILGLVVDPMSVSEHLFDHLGEIIGDASVTQLRQTLQGFRQVASNWYVTIGGFIFLIFVATTLFTVIKNSLNQLWGIGTGKSAFNRRLINRLQAVAVIILSGLLFLAAAMMLGAEAVQIGTAFLACDECNASAIHKERLFSEHAQYTVLTKLFSGRLARTLSNKVQEEMQQYENEFAPFPLQRYFMRPLFARIMATGDHPDYLPYMSGQSAPLLKYRQTEQLFDALVNDAGKLLSRQW